MLSEIVMISFYFLSERFFLKGKILPDARVASITTKNMALQYIFVNIQKVFKVNI